VGPCQILVDPDECSVAVDAGKLLGACIVWKTRVELIGQVPEVRIRPRVVCGDARARGLVAGRRDQAAVA
jgi:ribosomal protein L35AE/L33A